MNRADTHNILEKFKETFSKYKLSSTIVSNNDTLFTSGDFSKFCELNIIKYPTIALGHPASIGVAKNSVKTFKLGFKKIV